MESTACKKEDLTKSTTVVSSMTMISRVLGFVRDMVMARMFGVSASVDAFYIAFKIPNFMRSLFAEGSFSQAFVPVLSEYRQTRTHEETRSFISHVFGILGTALLILTIIGVLAAPLLVIISAPGLEPTRFQMASEMLRITFPYLMLISLTAFSGAILNSYGLFSIPSLTPALLNVTLITTALWLSHRFDIPVEAQAWGVCAAGLLQLSFQIPFLCRKGFLVLPKICFKDPGVRKVLKLMIPAIFGASVIQISLLLNTIFASFLKVGSVTWLYYSDRLAYFPLGVFGVALATVILPHLSRQHVDSSPKHFMNALDWGIRCNLLIGIPAAIVLWLFAGPIITTLFQYGKFNAYDVMMTRKSVVAYAIGLQAFMLAKLLATGFYSRQDVRTPVRYSVITLIFNMFMNAILIIPLAHVGLALATSLSAWLNVSLLFFGLHKQGVYRLRPGWGLFGARLLCANILMLAFLWWQSGDLHSWIILHWDKRLLHLFSLLIIAMTIYFITLFFTGFRLKDITLVKEA